MENEQKNIVEVTARCIHVGPVETFPSGFTKRIVVVEWTREGSKYPSRLSVNLKKDQVNLVNEGYEGKTIYIKAFVESHEWTNPKNGKLQYFTEANCNKIALADGETADTPSPATPEPEADPTADDVEMPF